MERFSIDCRKTITKVITTANQKTGEYLKKSMRTESKNNNTQRAGKHGFIIASDWLRKWREFSGPITEHK